MASYQELDVRVAQLTRMVEFVMNAFKVVDVGNPFAQPRTLLEEYYRAQQVIVTPPGVVVEQVEEPVEPKPVLDAPEVVEGEVANG